MYPEIALLNYQRSALRWDAWGTQGTDFAYPELLPAIVKMVQREIGAGHLLSLRELDLDEIKLPASRLPSSDLQLLLRITGKEGIRTDRQERVLHSCGQSYYDVIRLKTNSLREFVDAVVYPENESQIVKIIQLAAQKNWAVIPFGGGTSVVGGVEALRKKQKAILSLDLMRLNQIIDISTEDHLVRAQAGIYGPELEKVLQEKGFTVSHFPQSFEYSTLGGWIAARGSGQQSGKYGKIEDMVYSARIVTPAGIFESDAVPAASTGPDLRSLLIGSEGALGVITEATLRIHPLPQTRSYRAFLFPRFEDGVAALQAATRAGWPQTAMLRLSDPEESRMLGLLSRLRHSQTATGRIKQKVQDILLAMKSLSEHVILIVGLEGAERDVAFTARKMKHLARAHGGMDAGTSAGNSWLRGRFNLPYLRNHLIPAGIGVDTFETAVAYSRLRELRENVYQTFPSVCKHGRIMSHLSHTYPDGVCIYFTIFFALENDTLKQWHRIKDAVSAAVIRSGGNISHHHGIGVDHKSFFKKSNPTAYKWITDFKAALDPAGIMNPGKLVD
ncbi:MAG: FAD-binding oxidoreductase [Spirochaetales bacterium]|nr:FAD-binding oxidoreductase [Spirochaetales bacterium]